MLLYTKENFDLVKVAKLYYEQDLTQQEIAGKMQLSRPQISKMLTKAKKLGIVHISINDSLMNKDYHLLLQQLCRNYKLIGGAIIPDREDVHAMVADAAEYWGMETQYERQIGIGWGYLIGELVDKLELEHLKKLEGEVYPLIGEIAIPNRGYRINELTLQLAAALGRQPFTLKVDAFVTSLEEKQQLEQQAVFRQLSGKWQNLDISLLALQNYPSVPDEATEMRFGSVLRTQRAVGSFLSYFYNVNGDILSGENDFAIRASLADLRHSRKVYGVGLVASRDCILGALRTGIFTHIILTERQAREVLG
jgi:deoxyribonucleoside regulator